MNRRKFFFKTIVVTTGLFLGLQVFNSCKKDEPGPVISDVLSTAPAENFKAMLTTTATLAALPADVKTAATTITNIVTPAQVTKFSSFDYASIVAQSNKTNYFQNSGLKSANSIAKIEGIRANLELLAGEQTKLDANDQATFYTVITRMLQVTPYTTNAELNAALSGMRADATINSYLIATPTLPTDLYAGNYSQGVTDVKAFITGTILPIFDKIVLLNKPSKTSEEEKQIATLTLIAFQNMNIYYQAFVPTFNQLHNV